MEEKEKRERGRRGKGRKRRKKKRRGEEEEEAEQNRSEYPYTRQVSPSQALQSTGPSGWCPPSHSQQASLQDFLCREKVVFIQHLCPSGQG